MRTLFLVALLALLSLPNTSIAANTPVQLTPLAALEIQFIATGTSAELIKKILEEYTKLKKLCLTDKQIKNKLSQLFLKASTIIASVMAGTTTGTTNCTTAGTPPTGVGGCVPQVASCG